MRESTLLKGGWVALAIAGMLAAAPAQAEKPEHPGGGPGEKHERGPGNGNGHGPGKQGEREQGHFSDRDRIAVHDYYHGEFSAGRCPPGLAKKHNGCMPPGQARRWQIGRPLPRDLIFYDLPQQLVIQLGVPPHGYRYVRVASDILLIAIGTGLVLDAIRDLGAS